FGSWYMAVYGAGIVLWMIYMPSGVAGKARSLVARWSGPETVGARAASGAAAWSHAATATSGDGGPGVVLRVEGVTKAFGGVVAVEGLSFEVRHAEIKSIIGPNGAGKTTALNLITGVYRPDAGSVYMGQTPLVGRAPHIIAAEGILRTFQNVR